MTLSFKERVFVPEKVMFRELEGESVLLNIDTDMYFGLDDVGTRMWLALTQSESIQAAYETLLEEYDIETDLLRRDLTDIVEKLVEKGLLEVGGGEV